jgi:hypothetical protein
MPKMDSNKDKGASNEGASRTKGGFIGAQQIISAVRHVV